MGRYRTMEEIHAEEMETKKKWCFEHHGWVCDKNCGCDLAPDNCPNHPDFGKAKERVLN